MRLVRVAVSGLLLLFWFSHGWVVLQVFRGAYDGVRMTLFIQMAERVQMMVSPATAPKSKPLRSHLAFRS